MYVMRTGEYMTSEPPVIHFVFSMTHDAQPLREAYEDYDGSLTVDGAKIYVTLANERNQDGKLHIRLEPCLAHVRNKFKDAFDILVHDGVKKEELVESIQFRILYEIAQMYKIEKTLKELSPEVRLQKRNEKMLDHFKKAFELIHSIDINSNETGDTLCRAAKYALQREEGLHLIFEDGNLPLDNLATERDQKLFCGGRRLWFFFFSPKGGKTAEVFLSLFCTAIANKRNPFLYLLYLFRNVPFNVERAKQLTAAELYKLNPWSDEYIQFENELNVKML